MKVYEYNRGENDRTAKLFGFPIMEQTSDYMSADRYQSFLGGIVTTIKPIDSYTGNSIKVIKVLGKSIIKRVEENNYRKYYFSGIKFREISLIDEFKKQYYKYFDKKYDDIYILNAKSGEIYLTLTYLIKTLIKRNQSKNPLLVATQKYHIDMIKMICPNIPYVYIKKLRLRLIEDSFIIDNFRFFLLYSEVYLKQVAIDIKANKFGESHYFKSILNRLNISEEEIEMNRVTVLPEAERSMLKKVNKTGLNLDKFVFLAPEAQSCKLYDEDFWIFLINKLQKHGYDVYVNLVEDTMKLRGAIDYKKCDLTFAEVFALAKRAKEIVSLRSGLNEFLLQTGVHIDVLYTKFKCRHFFDDMDVYQVISGFSLTQIPFVDKSKFREFSMFELSPANCISKIFDRL